MLKALLAFFKQKEEHFLPGQRVRLIGGYPSDMANEAQRNHMQGTVQPATEYAVERGNVLVLWDGYAHVRYMCPEDLSPVVFDLKEKHMANETPT